MVRIVIREDRCKGSGNCSALAPVLVTTDALGQGVPLHEGVVPEGLELLARALADACPQGAICFDDES